MVWVEIKVRLSSELADPTSYLFNKYATGLVTQQVNDNMIECTTYVLKSNKKELFIVDDKVGTPTYTYDFAKNTEALIDTNNYGLYNMSCQ